MQNIYNIQVSANELSSLVEAYSTIQSFLEKVLTPEQIYNKEFINGLNQSILDIKNKDFVKVTSFEEFVN